MFVLVGVWLLAHMKPWFHHQYHRLGTMTIFCSPSTQKVGSGGKGHSWPHSKFGHSVSVIKCPDQNQFGGERVYFSLQSQVSAHDCREATVHMLETAVSFIHSRDQREGVQTCMLTCFQHDIYTHTGFWTLCLGNDGAHSGLVLPYQ